MQGLSQEPSVAAIFPSLTSVSNTLYRSRHAALPKLPQNTENIDIPENFLKTHSGASFLLYQSDSRHIMVFGTTDNLTR